MAHDFRLLFEAIILEPTSFDQRIVITAEWMPHEREVEPPTLLGLPHVRQFMDEQALPMQRLFREILRPKIRMGVEMDTSRGRHGDVAGVKGPPLAADHSDFRIIDGVAEHAFRELDLP